MKLRDTFLLYGPPSCGKTTALVHMASLMPEKTFYVIDADNKFMKVWKLGFPDVTNIEYHLCKNWAELKLTYDNIRKQIKHEDFLCLEMVDRYWDMAQAYYDESVYGKDMGQQLLQLKVNTQSKGIADPDSMSKWNVIKRMHNQDFLDDATSYLDCDVVLTTSASTLLPGQFEAQETKDLYGQVGMAANGEKRNGYRVDTIVLMDVDLRSGKRFWTSVKDKERPYAHRREYQIWWSDYWRFVNDSNRHKGTERPEK